MATERPPLSLQAELVYPDGTTVRWDKDSRESKDRPSGIKIRTQRYTGFADAQVTLKRRIDLEYPDLGLLNGLNLIGHDGSVAYEGRIASMPRDLQTTPQVTVQAQGWMSHAKDQPFSEIYIDRDLAKWEGPSIARQIDLVKNGYSPSSSSTGIDPSKNEPALVTSFTGPWVTGAFPSCEGFYDSHDIPLGRIYYQWRRGENINGADANWAWRARIGSTDTLAELVEEAFTSSVETGSGTLNAPEKHYWASMSLGYGAVGGEANKTYAVYWHNLAVYGRHGLTPLGTGPGGFLVSDMMAHIAQNWAPKLDTGGISTTDYAVPHAAFLDDTYPYDAFTVLNAYHRWELAVYEKRKLLFYPIDLGDYDWEIRLSDPGTKVTLQGDDTQNLCNGVIVRYTDLNTGTEQRLTPSEYPELADNSPNNPANLNGDTLWTPLRLSVPTTKGAALQIGSVFLNEFNQAKSPGQITVMGHIRDRAGHWQPAWKVRSSDRVIISDMPNDSVRVVGETEWDHDSKTLSIGVDSSFKRLDAILARFGIALEAGNLSLR